jgi:hypothetical protein
VPTSVFSQPPSSSQDLCQSMGVEGCSDEEGDVDATTKNESQSEYELK